MNAKIVVAMLSILLLLVACAKQAETPTPAPITKPEPVPAPEPAIETDAAVSDIETSAQEVEKINQDFDTTEIDTIDVDLAVIDQLDFE